MKSTSLEKYQLVLQHLRQLLAEIDYSRFLATKNDCTLVIEDQQQIVDWSEQLKLIVEAIHTTSENLQSKILDDKGLENALETTEAAIDDLIYLHKEIISSCAYEPGLMEGRYLIGHLVGSYLDQIGAAINEYRYQLNKVIFNFDQTAKSQPMKLSLGMRLSAPVEIKAMHSWLSAGEVTD